MLPSHNERQRKARAEYFAQKVYENTDRHGPLACAVAINCVLIALGGLVTIRSSLAPNEDAIEVSLGTEGFLTEDTSSSPPAGGGSAAQAVLEQAAQQMMTATPTPAVPTDLTAITTMANTALAFDVKPAAPSTPSIGVPTIKAPTVAKGTGTGTGEGQGTGTGNGTGSGTGTETGQGTGSGTGTGQRGGGARIGTLHIEGARIGILHDTSGSMGDRMQDVRKIAREQMGSQAIIAPIANTALYLKPKPFNLDVHEDFGDMKQYLGAFQKLAEKNVESIFLVTDLEDGQDDAFMNRLGETLRAKKIRLYVSSSRGYAIPSLLRLIATTGGGYEWSGHQMDAAKLLPLLEELYTIEEGKTPKEETLQEIHEAFVQGDLATIETLIAETRTQKSVKSEKQIAREKRMAEVERVHKEAPYYNQTVTVQGINVTLLPHGQLQWANNNTGATNTKQTRSESIGPDGKVTQESSTFGGKISQDAGQRQGGSWKLNDANQIEVTLSDGEVVVIE
ncbi:MAG: hypothetical protein BGO12_13420 [Verrucomicrobia bacterium 61-8]|nr:MAG: hypothetical protein BGO12_13420 [Verrucomicrobia bacterium 61-8]